MQFKIYSFGCKVNQYESEYIKQLMLAEGYDYSEDDKNTDVFIVNSCSVTAVSDSKCRKLLHKLRRENTDAVILLCGCMSQAFPRKYDNFSDCNIVIGNTTRTRIPEYISEYLKTGERIIDISDHDRKNEEFELCSVENFSERTRAFLKIEDGCDRFCSYCIIPYARGRVRSKLIEDISTEVEKLAQNGYSEIVLVGINLSKYGTDIDKNLCDAVEVVASNERIKRIRLGSLEPELLDNEMIKRLAECEKFCPQFHLSLQSGCDATLKRMNRHYNSAEYYDIVQNIRRNFENPAITTDVMVGFPGENDEEFAESLNFVEKVEFSKVHVFPYSRRSGTVADKMPQQLEKSVKEKRAKKMIQATEINRNEFLKSQIGLVCEVLFERTDKQGLFEGYSKNYTPVLVDSHGLDLSGQCIRVKITSVKNDKCIGIISDSAFENG
ncbi:MAG: tRNA (N(6)-L-threonylcarbamoyladenosine(37)-C(2))-methylthiotransferase MtaB [Clostridia bacterium]|nr:tRNA (N(6)-L-threonylcarbamoyladenosine(37)-C(2))-methylthiotransferase MtaB [Clostridia bacterium]